MGRFCAAITLSGWLIWTTLAGAQVVAPVKIAAMPMTWNAFLKAHHGMIAATDLFTVEAVPRFRGIVPPHEALDAIAQLARQHPPPVVVAMTGTVGRASGRHRESRVGPVPGRYRRSRWLSRAGGSRRGAASSGILSWSPVQCDGISGADRACI